MAQTQAPNVFTRGASDLADFAKGGHAPAKAAFTGTEAVAGALQG